MKLNNKGFALTSMIYMLIVLFLMIMLLVLSNLAQRKVILDRIRYDIKNKLEQGVSINVSELPYQNQRTGIYYETLELAINKASSGDTIQVLKNVTDQSIPTVPSGKIIKIDIAGKEVDLSQTITNNGTLDIYSSVDGGKINNSASTTIWNYSYFSLNSTSDVHNVSIINTSNVTNSRIIINGNNAETVLNANANAQYINSAPDSDTDIRYIVVNYGKVTVNGATLKNNVNNLKTERGIINVSTAPSARIIINSGLIETGQYSLFNNGGTGNTFDDPTIKITGGTIKSNSSFAIRNDIPNCLVHITGGNIISDTTRAIYISKGTLTLGVDDGGTPSVTEPNIISKNYSMFVSTSSGTIFNYYDGKITGTANSVINKQPNNKPSGYVLNTVTDGPNQIITLQPQ